MKSSPEVIVLGLGGMGSAAAWRLAKTGAQVRAFDPHVIGHALGSSHGEARMVRQAYFEHSDYVPLLKLAYRLWGQLEKDSGTHLFHRNGVVIYGPEAGSKILPSVLESAKLHGLEVTRLSRPEALHRFPEYHPPEGFEAVLEPDAGFVEVENAVIQAARLAAAAGAELHIGEQVRGWRPAAGGGVEVETSAGTYHADKLIITAGPWSQKVLGDELKMALEPRRVVQLWFRTRSKRGPEALPCFGFELPDGFIYGFPLSPGVLKVALHKPGASVPNPDQVDRDLHPTDLEPIQSFIRKHMPEATDELIGQSVCMYTMTADQHFVIDRHPLSPDVIFAAGFSGHGFKFAPAIGEILSELALTGETHHPIGFLRMR